MEVLNWDIDTEQKDRLCFYIIDLVNRKYENIENISVEKLSTRVGILELERFEEILNKYKNVSDSIIIPNSYKK